MRSLLYKPLIIVSDESLPDYNNSGISEEARSKGG
jgi:hypothetical protein